MKIPKGVLLVVSILGIGALCSFGAVAYSVWRSFQPKTVAFYYPQASITELIKRCKVIGRYPQPQDWMDVSSGDYKVLKFSYSRSSPFPDSFTAYSLYLQLRPGEFLQGTKYDVRQDLQSILVTTCGYPPDICCTQDINGSIQVLEVSEQTVQINLAFNALVSQTSWEYKGKVIFEVCTK